MPPRGWLPRPLQRHPKGGNEHRHGVPGDGEGPAAGPAAGGEGGDAGAAEDWHAAGVRRALPGRESVGGRGRGRLGMAAVSEEDREKSAVRFQRPAWHCRVCCCLGTFVKSDCPCYSVSVFSAEGQVQHEDSCACWSASETTMTPWFGFKM